MVDNEYLENRIATLEKEYENSVNEHKEIFKRLNEKDIADAIMREQLDTVVKTTNRIEEKLDKQSKIPADRWNAVVNTITTGITGAVVGAIIGLILK